MTQAVRYEDAVFTRSTVKETPTLLTRRVVCLCSSAGETLRGPAHTHTLCTFTIYVQTQGTFEVSAAPVVAFHHPRRSSVRAAMRILSFHTMTDPLSLDIHIQPIQQI